jgi:hypothetical protein
VLGAPAGAEGLRIIVVQVVVDACVLGQVRLAPQAADVVQAGGDQHVGHGAPVNVPFLLIDRLAWPFFFNLWQRIRLRTIHQFVSRRGFKGFAFCNSVFVTKFALM